MPLIYRVIKSAVDQAADETGLDPAIIQEMIADG